MYQQAIVGPNDYINMEHELWEPIKQPDSEKQSNSFQRRQQESEDGKLDEICTGVVQDPNKLLQIILLEQIRRKV